MATETELISKYKKGDQESLNILFEQNEKLIYYIYERFFRDCGCPKEDLYQEGCLGLFEAITRFDPAKENQFNGYKSIWIKKKMFDFRRKFFKLNIIKLEKEHELIEWEPPKSDRLRKIVFDIDNLVESGMMKKSGAQKLLNKVIKGTR